MIEASYVGIFMKVLITQPGSARIILCAVNVTPEMNGAGSVGRSG
jgi:hypothetical protein